MAQLSTPPASPASGGVASRLQRERDLYAEALGGMTLRYEQKIQELSLLRHTSEALRDCTDLNEVIRRLLRIVQEELATPAASLYLADDSGELVLRARCWSNGRVEVLRPRDPAALRIAPKAGPLGQTFTTGEVLVNPPIPDGTPGWFPADAPVLLTAPLGPTGGCMGVLALHERRMEDVPEDASRLLPILAGQATIAIENAGLYQRLKQHTDTLEARVRERTAALEHLNAELQAAARQKSQFFAHFSHELRTPLNSILGFSEMLLAQMHGPLSETQVRHVRHVHESGGRLLRLINDILDLAKVEAGKLSLQVQPIHLSPSVEQALAVMQPQARAKHLGLEQVTPPDLPRILADPARVHQILLNLLSNAIKFTPDGGSITVRAFQREAGNGHELAGSGNEIAGSGQLAAGSKQEASGGEQTAVPTQSPPLPPAPCPLPAVVIEVTDTGIGIGEEDQGRLFRDFEQVAGGQQQGTGLGLSLTRRLVALHGGQIGLRSVPDQGSTFWFTLPVAAPAAGNGRDGSDEA
ncbi:MAG TPA: ATP-binding protein [Candidatus Methylomirabilis sp.]|nr:ATP-binding protein [Candidatus Methylomirabilis sp.]